MKERMTDSSNNCCTICMHSELSGLCRCLKTRWQSHMLLAGLGERQTHNSRKSSVHAKLGPVSCLGNEFRDRRADFALLWLSGQVRTGHDGLTPLSTGQTPQLLCSVTSNPWSSGVTEMLGSSYHFPKWSYLPAFSPAEYSNSGVQCPG